MPSPLPNPTPTGDTAPTSTPTGDTAPTTTPTGDPTPAPLPWPQVAPRPAPQAAPFADPAPPADFTATPTPDPLPPDAPGTQKPPTDLLNPGKAPTNLGGQGSSSPTVDPAKEINKKSDEGLTVAAILAVVLPILLLEGTKQRVNTPTVDLIDKTKINPAIRTVTPPPAVTATVPNPPTCIYERQRVMDIQNKATDVQGRAANPVTGFPGLYGIGIESRVKLGETFTLLGSVNTFMRKAWQSTQVQKVMDALTLMTVLHNATMISRDVGETLGYAISQGLDVLGIEDEEGNALDVNNWFGTQATNFLENLFGTERWHGLNEAWNKANRIIQSASNIIWTIRSLNDGTQEVLEWTAENTGKIGNALKKWGVVGEKAYKPMAERVKSQDLIRRKTARFMDGLESVENITSSYAMAISEVKEIQDEGTELVEQVNTFAGLVGYEPERKNEATPDENTQIATANEAAAAAAKAGPDVVAADMEPGGT